METGTGFYVHSGSHLGPQMENGFEIYVDASFRFMFHLETSIHFCV